MAKLLGIKELHFFGLTVVMGKFEASEAESSFTLAVRRSQGVITESMLFESCMYYISAVTVENVIVFESLNTEAFCDATHLVSHSA